MAILEVRGVCAAYGKHTALRDVSLTIEPGRIVGLLGPNGAGKTTLMDVVVGKTRPTSGSVSVCGMDVARQARACRERIGYAAQDLAVFPTLTARENVRNWAGISGVGRSGRDRAVDVALSAMLLEDVADRQVRTLSGGQQRRVHCAMATAARPPLLLLDEPTVGVDPATRRALLQHVRELAAEGTAICYSTHYLPEVEALDAEVVLLKDGRTAARGRVDDLLGRFGQTVIEMHFKEDDDGTGTAGSVSVVADGPGDLPKVLRGLGPDLDRLAGLEVRRPSLDEVFDRIVEEGGKTRADAS
ncbi:hypothetical protein A6A06_16175 [Streptomyces sp. CB02923]|uniref:ABC transporter ATP-binding protein n=1 Tax=Streptomyces sp. CB02923 TaxID=1718985 RepID=UPI0009661E02|nr:ABC transporter ATP-binding protein [Streptomyces sp. CB02923]OKI02551.1 hypothetical protein A6A06_16175 [Streptomyces sp. CB02923]